MMSLQSPIPISDIESILAWVDTFKLSRTTKKINRDFSDAVLLAEILYVHYPKLVEMHNYPPRNSHALKLNNWMTLNRKVLKKLKLSLCYSSLEQLANATPGLIERVLISVRDKILRDEEANKPKGDENEMSSGGSYHEALGDDENILVVPVKNRVNGTLEIIHQKVINYNSYLLMKEELKDAKETTDVLKQKVDHFDNLLKLKDERIEELQKQLERKASRRKEIDVQSQNSWTNIDASSSYSAPPTAKNSQIFPPADNDISVNGDFTVDEPIKSPILNNFAKVSVTRIEVKPASKTKFGDDNVTLRAKPSNSDSKMAKKSSSDIKVSAKSSTDIKIAKKSSSEMKFGNTENPEITTKVEIKKNSIVNTIEQANLCCTGIELVTAPNNCTEVKPELDGVNSEIFVEAVVDNNEEYQDSEQDETNEVTTIEDSIKKEIQEISNDNIEKDEQKSDLIN